MMVLSQRTHRSSFMLGYDFASVNKRDIPNSYPGAVNLSSYHLINSELSLFSKGLTFVCTPGPPDMGTIFED